MPSTYTLISSNVLSSSAASVTFSAIPATYTDLVLRISARGDNAGNANLAISYNGATTSFSYTRLTGDGSTAASFRSTNNFVGLVDSAANTANTFGSAEIYIPSYAATQNKPASIFVAQEDNSSTATIAAIANLRSNTAAITSITIAEYSANNWVSGSSFYLYGIKNT